MGLVLIAITYHLTLPVTGLMVNRWWTTWAGGCSPHSLLFTMRLCVNSLIIPCWWLTCPAQWLLNILLIQRLSCPPTRQVMLALTVGISLSVLRTTGFGRTGPPVGIMVVRNWPVKGGPSTPAQSPLLRTFPILFLTPHRILMLSPLHWILSCFKRPRKLV